MRQLPVCLQVYPPACLPASLPASLPAPSSLDLDPDSTLNQRELDHARLARIDSIYCVHRGRLCQCDAIGQAVRGGEYGGDRKAVVIYCLSLNIK